MKLSKAEASLLQGLIEGGTLKVHRYPDGAKIYRLHPLAGAPQPVRRSTADDLKAKGLIDSNKKFPAATYLLTEQGKVIASTLGTTSLNPLSSKKF